METVKSINEAMLNAEEFNRLSSDSQSKSYERFSSFFHWYYFSTLDIFAPCKFIGYGNTTVDNYEGKGHGGETRRILSKWFEMINPASDEFLSLQAKLESYAQGLNKKVNKQTFNGKGGIYILKGEFTISNYPDEVNDANYREGAVRKITVNAYERDTTARSKCISHYGTACYVCGFDFEEEYGEELGSGFIHVHHIVELSSIGEEYSVDPINDLRPLCPNCHAMVHKRKPAIHPDELKSILNVSG